MVLAIDHRIETIQGHDVHFLRVADNYGWYAEIDGKRYGDWLTSEEEAYDSLRLSFGVTIKELEK